VLPTTALILQHVAEFTSQSTTDNCEWRTCPRSLLRS